MPKKAVVTHIRITTWSKDYILLTIGITIKGRLEQGISV